MGKVGRKKRTGDDIAERLLDFAARAGKIVDALPNSRLGKHIAGQLVRCGTSPASNYAEACGAESRRDFAHKLSLALKELRECRVWLQLIIRSELLPQARLTEILDECEQLCAIIAKSTLTAKKNEARQNKK